MEPVKFKMCLSSVSATPVKLFVCEDQKFYEINLSLCQNVYSKLEEELRLQDIWSKGQGQSDFTGLPAVF